MAATSLISHSSNRVCRFRMAATSILPRSVFPRSLSAVGADVATESRLMGWMSATRTWAQPRQPFPQAPFRSFNSLNRAWTSRTNSIHGEAFGLFRDDSQAAAYPGGAKFQRSQYGGDVGGAIIKDKLFYFVDAERLLAHDAGGVLVAPPLNSFSGTFPARFSDTSTIGKLDYQISKNLKVFGRFSFWQGSDVGNFGGAANYSVYDNKDRTKTIAGGVDFNEGSFTHSFRAEYLKFVNVISDAVQGSSLPFAFVPNEILLSGTGFESGPSFLAPQSTIQSDRQVKYDGSHVWGSHIIRWGVDYNRITGWTFSSFFGLAPQDV